MNRRRIATSRTQLPAATVPQVVAKPKAKSKPVKPVTVADWLMRLRDLLTAALGQAAKHVKETSSYVPSTYEEKYAWEMYVDEYGRWPSKPDVMAYMVRHSQVLRYQRYLLQELAEELRTPDNLKLNVALLEELCNRAHRREKFVRDELIKLAGAVRDKHLSDEAACRTLEQFARLMAALPEDIRAVYFPPKAMAEVNKPVVGKAASKTLLTLQGSLKDPVTDYISGLVEKFSAQAGLEAVKVSFTDKSPVGESDKSVWSYITTAAQHDPVLAGSLISKEEVDKVDKKNIPVTPKVPVEQSYLTPQTFVNAVVVALVDRIRSRPGWRVEYLRSKRSAGFAPRVCGSIRIEDEVITFEVAVSPQLSNGSPEQAADFLFDKIRQGVEQQQGLKNS